MSLLVGLTTTAVIVFVNRTRLEKYSFLIAVAFATGLVLVVSSFDVPLVGDTADIPRSVPSPNLPDVTLIPSLLLPVAAIAIIALVQAAGVSGSVPNPDGDEPDPSHRPSYQATTWSFFNPLEVSSSPESTNSTNDCRRSAARAEPLSSFDSETGTKLEVCSSAVLSATPVTSTLPGTR